MTEKNRSWLLVGRFARESLLILLGAVLAALAGRFIGRDAAAYCPCQRDGTVERDAERDKGEIMEDTVSVHVSAQSVKSEGGAP